MANHAGAGGRPQGRRTVSAEDKAAFFRLVDQEHVAHTVAAQMLGFSAMTGSTWIRKRAQETRTREELAEQARLRQLDERDRLAEEADLKAHAGKFDHPRVSGQALGTAEMMLAPPCSYDQLSLVAQCAVHESPRGFEIFRRRYLGRRSKPWQKRAVIDLLAAEAEARTRNVRYYMIANVFPGGGKSTTFTHDYATWRIVCARVRRKIYRVQLGSESITQSRSYVTNIRSTFETNLRLIEAFGRFKPLKPILWMTTAITIDYPVGTKRDEKEPTVFAVSKDSSFLGFRCELAMWDDLVSKKNSRTVESRIEQYAWWIAEAQSRVNPGGLCALIGTRANRDDLFKRLSLLRVTTTDSTDTLEVERPIYNRFTYPVHDVSKCVQTASLRRADHVDCLGDPDRYPWEEVQTIRAADSLGFELTFQQNDVGLEDQLVQDIWLTGGVDSATGDMYPGCYDRDRTMWQAPPPHALADYRCAIVVDPSPTQWWAVEVWVWDRTSDIDYLVGLERRRMQVGDLLDMKPGTLEYTGLLEDMLLKLREIGIDCYYVIIEDNAAQRFMLQYGFIRAWSTSRNVVIRGHGTTHEKLGDEHYGIETLGPRYRQGRVNLPMANPASRERVSFLTREAMSFPDGETDDCLKAQWFFHYNRDSLSRKKHQRRYYSSDSELSPRLAMARHGKAAW